MRPWIRGLAVALAASSATVLAHADSSHTLVRFEGGIGVDPLTANGAGIDAPNVVRGVNPGGRAWVIRKLQASIDTDGRIAARGAGLLLASGDVIGTRAGIAQVIATLACGPNATATLFHSPPAALDTAGNFRISGVLTQDGVNAAVLPATCDNPALLIRSVTANGTPGVWFAAGIVSDGDHDD